MNGLRAVRLVAERDLRERLRTRAYRISAALTVALVVAAVVVPRLLGDGDERPRYGVAVVGAASAPVREAVARVAAGAGAEVRLVDVADVAAAEDRLSAEEVDLAVVPGDAVVTREPVELGDPSTRARLVAGVAEAVGLQASLEAAGLSPERAAEAVARAPLAVRSLEPGRADEGARRSAAFVGSLLLYTFLALYGTWVLYGVAEEKSTRVAEVLLSALRPTQLLAGKVIGVGLAALAQGVLVLAAVVVAAAASGSDLLDAVSVADLASVLGWFLLGYALYSVVYAAAGSLVSRQEDVQNVATPPSLPLLVGYLVAVQAAFGGGDGPLVRAASLFPATAPIVMPVRTTVADVPAWEVALAVVLTLGAIVALVRVAGAVYARALLRTGRRTRWREALRARPA